MTWVVVGATSGAGLTLESSDGAGVGAIGPVCGAIEVGVGPGWAGDAVGLGWAGDGVGETLGVGWAGDGVGDGPWVFTPGWVGAGVGL